MKVSIIVPVYNVENYIENCIESIVNQTYKNIEIIFVIDGSTDNSEEIIMKYANKDKRIIILSRENKGHLYSRIDGINIATGDYVTFLDSDDWIDLEFVEKMLEHALKYKTDIVRCFDVLEFEGQHRKKKTNIYNEIKYFNDNDFKNTVITNMLTTYSMNSINYQLIKINLLKKMNINNLKFIKKGEDLVFNMELYKHANNILILPDCMYHYRINNNSIMNKEVKIDQFENELNDIYESTTSIKVLLEEWNLNNSKNKELINKRLVYQLNAATNTEFCVLRNARDRRTIIKIANDFIICKNIGQNYSNLDQKIFLKNDRLSYIFKLLLVYMPYIIKKKIKKILSKI